MNNDTENESIFITDDETGTETELLILDNISHNGTAYFLTVEAEDADDADAAAVIFKETADDNGEAFFEPLDDAEFEVVAKLFQERSGGEYEIEYE